MKEGILYHELQKHVMNTRFKRIRGKPSGSRYTGCLFQQPLNRGWLEAKQFELPKLDTTPVKVPFRAGQYNWLMDEVAHGGIAVLGMVTDLGYFFAINSKIQEVYEKADFTEAMTGKEGLLWFVDKAHLNWFFNSVAFCME